MTAVVERPAATAVLFTVAELLDATGGRLAARSGGDSVRGVHAVAIDSRRAAAGSLFVALRGERTDGHAYLADAVKRGARALLVSEAGAAARAAEVAGIAARGVVVVVVAETLAALQALARFHLGRLSLVARVGVTGSNGKTTTKEIIGAILSREGPTAVNPGNLNSETGLPLACFRVGQAHRWAVLELAVNHPGEMEPLAEIVRPDVALITNIGTAHVGLLGSQERIAREKRAIFSRFTGGQVALLPEGEPYFDLLAEGVRGRVVAYGPRSTPGYRGSESLGLDGTLIHWEGFRVRFPLGGEHNLANALGAVSVARELGIGSAAIRDGLEAVVPLFGRSQVLKGEATVLFDGYNANPDSMERALVFVAGVPWSGRRVAVLGGMRELGDESPRAHRELGRLVGRLPFDAVFLLGAEMREARDELARSSLAAVVLWEEAAESLARRLATGVKPGDLVLVKGSRGLELERLLPALGVQAPGGEGPAWS